MAQAQDRPLNELLSRSMVDIYVGPENTHWILHEKLLCHRSKFFSKIFYTPKSSANSTSGRTFGLPDEEDASFRAFVGWLYSGFVKPPTQESDLGDLFDLYLMGEKWQIAGLVKDVLDATRAFYRHTDTYPGLRRVQYIYANTDSDSPMRQLLVGSVARMLVTKDGIATHWDKALRKNGQLAVDIILAIQAWKVPAESVPDPREEAMEAEKEKVRGVEEGERNMSDEKVQQIKQEGSAEHDGKSEHDASSEQEEDADKTLVNGTESGAEKV